MTVDCDVQAEWSRAMPEWRNYMAGLFGDLIWWRGRQLTTGDVPPRVCLCRTVLVDGGTQFHAVQWTNPACSLHGDPLRSRPVATYGKPPACTCRYGLHPTIWSPTHRVDVPGVGMRGAAYTFRIDRRCPYHGDGNTIVRTRTLADGSVIVEPPPWLVLDDAERRGD